MRNLFLTALLGIMCPFNSFSGEFISTPSFTLSASIQTSIGNLFSYPTGTNKAGSNSVLAPTIIVKGGSFSYKRITSGPGMITLDPMKGTIDLMSADPGLYDITYSVGKQTETIRIEIN